MVRSTRQFFRYLLLALLVVPVLSAPATNEDPDPAPVTPFSAATSFSEHMIVHDSRNAAPEGFVSMGPVDKSETVTLMFGLKPKDNAGMIEKLYAVSTPGSKSYGQHLTKEQLEVYSTPDAQTTSKFNSWITKNGLTSKQTGAAWHEVTLTVGQANDLLATTYTKFRHTDTNTESFQTLSYSVPADLKDDIEAVEPTTSFPNAYGGIPAFTTYVQGTNASSSAAPPCNQYITPGCLVQSYGIPTTRATQARNVLSVPGFLNEYASRQDLVTFLSNYRPDLNGATFTDQSIDGGQNPQQPGTAGLEANLDIQYTVGLVNFAPVVFYSSGLGNINGFINMANSWLNSATPPTVVTISYGFNENQVSASSANTLCNLYGQLGSRGVSVLFASGDGGVSGSRLNNSCTTFVPTYPATCPYITAVGATVGVPEAGAGLSAGGFSNYFGQASYQSSAVNGYLNQIGSLYSGRFNRGGRAYPDVAAQGDRIIIVRNQTAISIAGTSASSPIFASVVTLLNDRLLSRGRAVLGFLNPWVYSHASVFTDITSGSNPGCNTQGFPAKAGWDAVTGFGSPSFPRMAAALGV